MKNTLILFIICISILVYSSAMAGCPVELPYKELVDCIAADEIEPDVTDLMSNEAEKLGKTSMYQLKVDNLNTLSALTKEPPQ